MKEQGAAIATVARHIGDILTVVGANALGW